MYFRCTGAEEDQKLKCELKTSDSRDFTSQWMLTTGSGDPAPIANNDADKLCDCPELKIPSSPGTDLACTNPIDPKDGFFTLGGPEVASNKCALFCDNFYIADLTCRFQDDDSGTAWMKSIKDGEDEKITVDCLSCWGDGCPSYLSTATTSTTTSDP